MYLLFKILFILFSFINGALLQDVDSVCRDAPSGDRENTFDLYCKGLVSLPAYDHTFLPHRISSFVSTKLSVTPTYFVRSTQLRLGFVNAVPFELTVLDFFSACNHYSSVLSDCSVNRCPNSNYVPISVVGGTLCIVTLSVIPAQYRYIGGLYHISYAPDKKFTLPGHPGMFFGDFSTFNSMRPVSTSPDTVSFELPTVVAYHEYFSFLTRYVFTGENLMFHCGTSIGIHFNLNFVSNSTCLFTHRLINEIVCAASYSLTCPPSAEIFYRKIHRYSIFKDTYSYNITNALDQIINSLSTISLPSSQSIANISESFQKFLNFYRTSFNTSMFQIVEAIKDPQQYKLFVDSLDQLSINLQKLDPTSALRSFNNQTLPKFLQTLRDPSQFKDLVNSLNKLTDTFDRDIKAFKNYYTALTKGIVSIDRTMAQLVDVNKKFFSTVNLARDHLKIDLKSFSDLINVVNKTYTHMNITLDSYPTEKLIDTLWRSYFFYLTKNETFLTESNISNVGSIFSWIGNILISVFKPFFEVFIDIMSELLMAVVDFLVDFEPYIEKILLKLEDSLLKIVSLIIRFLYFLLELIYKFILEIDTRFHFFELLVLWFFIYFYYSRNLVICFVSLFVCFCFIGTDRYFPSLLPAFQRFFTTIHHYLHSDSSTILQILTVKDHIVITSPTVSKTIQQTFLWQNLSKFFEDMIHKVAKTKLFVLPP